MVYAKPRIRHHNHAEIDLPTFILAEFVLAGNLALPMNRPLSGTLLSDLQLIRFPAPLTRDYGPSYPRNEHERNPASTIGWAKFNPP